MMEDQRPMADTKRLDEIADRAKKATEQYDKLRASFDEALRGGDQERTFKALDAWLYYNQRDLIGHAREDIPYLLSALRTALEENARMREALKACAAVMSGEQMTKHSLTRAIALARTALTRSPA